MIEVVCGIIYYNNKIFIARRKSGLKLAGKWEFPGGKEEPGESKEEALSRELIEEFGMKVKINQRIGEITHKYPQFTIQLTAFSCEFISASFNLTDHDKFEWVYLENISKYDLAESDIPFLELI